MEMTYLDVPSVLLLEKVEIGPGSQPPLLNEHFTSHVTDIELLELFIVRVQIDEVDGDGHQAAAAQYEG